MFRHHKKTVPLYDFKGSQDFGFRVELLKND
jgi:hypothetical protein